MKRIFSCLLLGLLTYCLPATQASAQTTLRGGKLKAKTDSLSPQQKKVFRQKLRARYDSLPPEEKEKIRQDIMNRIDTMSTDSRKKWRQHFKDTKKNNG